MNEGSGDVVPLVEPKRRDWGPRRKSRLVLAVALAWAVIASGGLAWVAYQNSTQNWNAEATFVDRLAEYFAWASYNLNESLLWNNATWGTAAAGSVGAAYWLVRDGAGTPGAPALAVALNLTETNLYCAQYGLSTAMSWGLAGTNIWNGSESLRPYFENMTSDLDALWTHLSLVSPVGEDPLAQLGPSTVAQVVREGGQLLVLTQRASQSIECPL